MPKMGLKMREIGFQRTYIFKIFRGSMPPDPPRKVRLRRTITFSITYEHPLENLSYAPGFKQSSGVAKKANSLQFHNRDHNLFPGIISRHTIEYSEIHLHCIKQKH